MSEQKRDFKQVGVFGSELLPSTSVIKSVSVMTVAFATEAEAAEQLLPYHFTAAPDGTVRVSHFEYRGIDYLAERGYNVLSVSVPAVLKSDPTIIGPYNIVIWEGLSHPVNLGRELQGYAKIHGDVLDAVRTPDGKSFECQEFGTTLITGEVHNIVPYSDEKLAKLQERSKEGYSLGWKYIPGVNITEQPDADYPTKTPNPVFYDSASTAEGSVDFAKPAWEEAPISHRVLEKLRELPVVKYHRAFLGTGYTSTPRVTVERLS